MTTIDMVSDLHGYYPQLDGGDLLIIAGDLTARDTYKEYENFFEYLRLTEYKRIIIVGGNHDNKLIEEDEDDCGFPPIIADLMHFHKMTYLCDSVTVFEGLKIWGTPWSLTFPGINPKCTAFTGTEEELAAKFALIPDDIDILISHSPPFGILDRIKETRQLPGEAVGSLSLNQIVLSRRRMPNLKLHVFGHIHEMGGKIFETNFTKFVNASYVNERYEPVNKVMRFEL